MKPTDANQDEGAEMKAEMTTPTQGWWGYQIWQPPTLNETSPSLSELQALVEIAAKLPFRAQVAKVTKFGNPTPIFGNSL